LERLSKKPKNGIFQLTTFVVTPRFLWNLWGDRLFGRSVLLFLQPVRSFSTAALFRRPGMKRSVYYREGNTKNHHFPFHERKTPWQGTSNIVKVFSA
jgi:hypothetical protein